MNNKNLKFDSVFLHMMINALGFLRRLTMQGKHTEVQLRQRSMTFPRIKTEHQFKRNQETYIQPGKCLLKWYQISARRTLLGNSQIMAIMMVPRCSLCAPTTRQLVFSTWRRKLWLHAAQSPLIPWGPLIPFFLNPAFLLQCFC